MRGATIGFDTGVILSSGAIASVLGPNTVDDATTVNGQAGDATLDTLLPTGQSSEDAAVLSFDFVPDASSVSFKYVFSSEEYNEYVEQRIQRRVRVLRERHELRHRRRPARVGEHHQRREPVRDAAASHPSLFRNNSLNDPGPATIDTQMDGLTTVLTCTAPVTRTRRTR